MQRRGEINSQLFGTSALRNVDPLGLCANAISMSRGGLGQIFQASLDDPTMGEYENVLVGGTNGTKKENFVSSKSFTSNIEESRGKLKSTDAEVHEKNFVLVFNRSLI